MQLISICKAAGHQVRLADISRGDVVRTVLDWNPAVLAYSVMTSDLPAFVALDKRAKKECDAANKDIFRIMGGPHPTHNPQIVSQLGLDCICQGEGDKALPRLLERLERNEPIDDIPNIAVTSSGAITKELVSDLDELPFLDRHEIYKTAPQYKFCGLRSFLASRGCPYHCAYCLNNALNALFSNCGTIFRRRSVDNLISEIEYVLKEFAPVKFVRFGDDTFTHGADDWLVEFSQKYSSRVGIPFYCLMRSNTLTEETARLLADAGCKSISMSIETGNENVRKNILNRNLEDETVIRSFKIAEKYGIRTLANSMVAIPGTALKDDFNTLEFVRKINPSVPTFGICIPYSGTRIHAEAQKKGLLSQEVPFSSSYSELSVLNCYTKEEKETQARIAYWGTLYCKSPKILSRLILKLIKSNSSLTLGYCTGMTFMICFLTLRIFYRTIPFSPRTLFKVITDAYHQARINQKCGVDLNKEI